MDGRFVDFIVVSKVVSVLQRLWIESGSRVQRFQVNVRRLNRSRKLEVIDFVFDF